MIRHSLRKDNRQLKLFQQLNLVLILIYSIPVQAIGKFRSKNIYRSAKLLYLSTRQEEVLGSYFFLSLKSGFLLWGKGLTVSFQCLRSSHREGDVRVGPAWRWAARNKNPLIFQKIKTRYKCTGGVHEIN